MNSGISNKNNGVILEIHVIPNAKKTVFAGKYDNRLKLKVASPPVDGAANKTIKHFFSKLFKISKSNIEIIKGEKNRDKTLFIKKLTIENVKKILEEQNANI